MILMYEKVIYTVGSMGGLLIHVDFTVPTIHAVRAVEGGLGVTEKLPQ